ncbi:hypothetical protein Airi01_021130 [Actinoallomurus iriomotensis]|uniref:Uncharacterized protein n=1 Tax=Actinoallomurus iriomotensis TaxID=478107 RepID=A0A9W6RD70_9ACTN|nr:hypothetical protein Airi01_021130 [Actinoallomurus iriomotensis]
MTHPGIQGERLRDEETGGARVVLNGFHALNATYCGLGRHPLIGQTVPDGSWVTGRIGGPVLDHLPAFTTSGISSTREVT